MCIYHTNLSGQCGACKAKSLEPKFWKVKIIYIKNVLIFIKYLLILILIVIIIRSMVKKWQTLIEANIDVKTTDGFLLRVFCIGFTAKDSLSQRKTCYAQHTQVWTSITYYMCTNCVKFKFYMVIDVSLWKHCLEIKLLYSLNKLLESGFFTSTNFTYPILSRATKSINESTIVDVLISILVTFTMFKTGNLPRNLSTNFTC